MALLRKKRDWKEDLPEEGKKILMKILDSTKKYRYAYSQADNVKIAQLWTALIEIRKELDETKNLMKQKTPDEYKMEIMEKNVEEIMKSSDATNDEATKRLVESLMKF